MSLSLTANQLSLSLATRALVSYLLRDDFTTTEAAPITSPRDAEPGPGTLTIVENDGQFSIAGGQLQIPSPTTPAWGDLGFYGSSQSRSAGRCLLTTLSLDNAITFCQLAWNRQTGVGQSVGGTEFNLQPNGSSFLTAVINTGSLDVIQLDGYTGTTYEMAIVLRGTGAFFLIKGGAFSEWTLLWVDAALNTSTLFPAFSNHSQSGSMDTFRLSDLPAPWDTDHGLASDRLSGSQSAGATFTHEADFLAEFTVDTLPSSGQIELFFRIQDANNYWAVTVNSSGDIDLDEVVAGSPTQRGSSTVAVSAGSRVVVVADDTLIRVYVDNAQEISYTNATNFKTETAGELDTLGTGGAASDVVSWPRVLSGSALAALERV